MKDKRPEKWCIKQNTHQDVCEWFRKYRGTFNAMLNGSYKYLQYNHITDTVKLTNESDYEEITLEQFRSYFSKENNNSSLEKYPIW